MAGMPSASPKSMGGMGLLVMSGESCIETSSNMTKHGSRKQQPEATQGGQMKAPGSQGHLPGEKVVGQVLASVHGSLYEGEQAR